MRVLICAGGSGGGIYPALSVWQSLKDRVSSVLWVGGADGMEETLVPREGIAFQSIPAAGLHGVGLRAFPRNLWKLLQGFMQARRIIRSFNPHVMLFTGGYVAVPVALAGPQVPVLLYVPDIEPGLALKTLARFADCIALIAPDSEQYFRSGSQLVVTGHPTRHDLTKWGKYDARQFFDLDQAQSVLLVFGGSKGARSINRAVVDVLPELLEHTQVIHITGSLDWAEIQVAVSALPSHLASRYRAYEYLHTEMGAAYAAADLVVSRSGASAVGEFPLFGLPAILVPYPHAWRYQKVNADFLVQHGAAVLLRDEEMASTLLPAVIELLSQPDRRAQMSAAMLRLANPNAAEKIAECLISLISDAARTSSYGSQ